MDEQERLYEAKHKVQVMDFVYVGRDQENQLKAFSGLLDETQS